MPAPDHPPSRHPATSGLTTFLVALAVLIATPLAVIAADQFDDVPDGNIHHDDITWLADADVTKGCNPPDNTEFCPEEPVLRQQMASFLRRLAENQVVDAGTVDGLDSTDLQTRWALVNADGTIEDQSGGITMATSGGGGYYLDFGSSVEGHALVATIKYRNAPPTSTDGSALVAPCGIQGTTCIPVGTNNPNHVWVLTQDQGGAVSERPFYVAVLP